MSGTKSDSPVLNAIFERRSVRHFLDASVDRELIITALKAATWAPSGLNNQPWRFAIVWDQGLKEMLGGLTRYTATLKSAAVLVPIFLDK
jgi:nitroreductase